MSHVPDARPRPVRAALRADGLSGPGRASGRPRCLVIGIAGGSGSGKTTISRAVVEEIGVDRVELIHHDSYYRDLASVPPQQRAEVNFDHPDSLETELLVEHLSELLRGRTIQKPVYDFTIHTRLPETITVAPKPVIIVEGILVLVDRKLRELMDLKIYVDTAPDIRLMRRLQRDVAERGRTMQSVFEQYVATVRPMHDRFVEPSKSEADALIAESHNDRAVRMLVATARDFLDRR